MYSFLIEHPYWVISIVIYQHQHSLDSTQHRKNSIIEKQQNFIVDTLFPRNKHFVCGRRALLKLSAWSLFDFFNFVRIILSREVCLSDVTCFVWPIGMHIIDDYSEHPHIYRQQMDQRRHSGHIPIAINSCIHRKTSAVCYFKTSNLI